MGSHGAAAIRPALVRSAAGLQNASIPGAGERSPQRQIDPEGQSSSNEHPMVTNERLHSESRAT